MEDVKHKKIAIKASSKQRMNNRILKMGTRSNQLISFMIATVVASLVVIIMRAEFEVFEDIEGSLLDARYQYRGAIPPSGLVEIVAIDEESIDGLGRWPWSREVVAQLIDEINALGANTVALDIIFSEKQPSAYTALLENSEFSAQEKQHIRQLAIRYNPDTALTTSMFMAGNVVNGHFFYFSEDRAFNTLSNGGSEAESQLLKSSQISAVKQKSDDFLTLEYDSVRTNLADFALAGEGAGFFNQIPDPDGVVRNAPLVIEFKEKFYPSLALKALSRYLNSAPIVLHANDYVITHLTLGDLTIATNEYGMLPINYRGPKYTINHTSALDVLSGKVDKDRFKDKLVLVGVTAIGVFDAHSSPFGPEFPGLEIQANVVESIINQDALQRNDFYLLIDYVVIFICAYLLAIFIPMFSRTPSRVIFTIMLVSLALWLNFYYFDKQHQWFVLFYPLLSIGATFIALMMHQSFMVERRYTHVRESFKHYISPKLVDQLTKDPDLLNFGGQEKELSILFSDIRSFTDLSEHLTPQALSTFLQDYMDPMTECVLNNQGTLDKYIGDAVMAIYGAPVPLDNHPQQACISALNMIDTLHSVEQKVAQDVPALVDLFPIKIGIGIHTGEVVVGNLGSSLQFNYTVIGDSVNLASRLEGLTKHYGCDIILSEVTQALVKDQFCCRALDLVRVKGKTKPVGLYELLGEKSSMQDESLAQAFNLGLWDQALSVYRAFDFSNARLLFQQYQQQFPQDVASQLYIERCEHFCVEAPDSDWDGVFTYTTK